MTLDEESSRDSLGEFSRVDEGQDGPTGVALRATLCSCLHEH
jgi:hypothetical protein